jgi:hypothetical protein
VLTTVKCAVVRLRALMAQQSARLITNRPIYFCPPKKEGISKKPYEVALKISNFGIHFWPMVTLVTLLKYGDVVYLAWRLQFRGQRP